MKTKCTFMCNNESQMHLYVHLRAIMKAKCTFMCTIQYPRAYIYIKKVGLEQMACVLCCRQIKK